MVASRHPGLASETLYRIDDPLIVCGNQNLIDGLSPLGPFVHVLHHRLTG
jgi:hypothetical protein